MSDNLTTSGLQYKLSNNGVDYETNWTSIGATGLVDRAWNITSGFGGSATNGPKTVSVRVRDMADNTMTFNCPAITFDNVAPTLGTFTYNPSSTNFSNYTRFSTVNLTLAGTDATSGVNSMQFSNSNGTTWSPWYTYGTTFTAWDFTSATYGGTTSNSSAKPVYARIRDAAGNISGVSSFSLYYDTVAPVPGTLSPAPATVTSRTVAVAHNMTDTGGSGIRYVQLWTDGYYSGWITPGQAATVLLTPMNGNKYVQAQYQDNAGNTSVWTPYQLYTQLAMGWSNYNRNEIAKATYNYAMPTGDNTSYMSVGAGSSILLDAAHTSGTYTIVYSTIGGLVGQLDYYSPTTANPGSIVLYYTTYNANGTTVRGGITTPGSTTWSTGTVSLSWYNTLVGKLTVAHPGYAYLDLDAVPAGLTTTTTEVAGVSDVRIKYYNGVFTLEPLGTAKFVRF